MMPDPIAAVRAFLLADAGVAALVADRVFGVEVPREKVQAMPQQCIVIRRSGSGFGDPGARSRIHMSVPRLDVFCYGATPHDAAEVDLTVYEALKQMRPNVTGNARLFDAQITAGPIDLREQETQWPLVFRSYSVAVAEVAVG